MDEDKFAQLSRLLNLFRLPAREVGRRQPAIYILGCFAERVTLYSQQVRALNLLDGLVETGRLQAGQKVCVIGAGAGGLTAAAAALRYGLSVTLLEQHDEPVALLKACTKRWLHPRVYGWPAAGAEDPAASLPLLTWTAGFAGTVREEILRQWEELAKPFRDPGKLRLREYYRTQIVALSSEAQSRVSWKTPDKPQENDRFDAIIVAVGFGIERVPKGLGLPVRSYWSDDQLEQLHLSKQDKDGKVRILVSGSGDGGLIDIQRVCFRRFRHDELHKLVTSADREADRQVRSKLLAIDADERSRDSAWLTNQYDELTVPPDVCDAIEKLLHPEIELTLHTRGNHWLQRSSSILNRFLVHRISKTTGYFTHRSGKSLKGKVNSDGGYRITIEGHETFDVTEAVIRHGPFPEVSKEPLKSAVGWSKEHFRTLALVDDSNIPRWQTPHDVFSKAAGLSPLTVAEHGRPSLGAPVFAKDAGDEGGAGTPTAPAEVSPIVRFDDVCRVNPESIDAALDAMGQAIPRLVWHPQSTCPADHVIDV